MDITIVTHAELPAGAVDDQLLAAALRRFGLDVRFAVWNDQDTDWTITPLTLIRSTWDYFRRQPEWFSWLNTVHSKTALQNSAELVLWNSDKRYLMDLSAKGIRCIPTVFAPKGGKLLLGEVCRQNEWHDIVVKPSMAASAFGARRFSGMSIETSGEAHFQHLLRNGDALVQPYLREVETLRERSLVFVSGSFAHAYTKQAFNANSTGSSTIERYMATDDEIAFASAALSACTEEPLYARVDLLPGENGPVLMELELIEPDLALRLVPATADLFAESCHKLVRSLRDRVV